ncbi:MAG TPA: DUF1643 domain-containing protein, partial [bacterium]|nr:DUF1643 domain-containing protein [bacterium]
CVAVHVIERVLIWEVNSFIEKLARETEITVAAWGNHGGYLNRDQVVVEFLPRMWHLGITKEGKPKHPLYLKANTHLQIMKENP